MHDLPGSLRLESTFPFVGRAAELETLRTLSRTAHGEGRRAVLVGGEAGSGKSRLVRESARELAADGALVLYGACDAVVPTPYGPFVEAFEGLVRTVDSDELRAALGPRGGELARLVPDLPARVPGLPPAVAADPDTERHRLHTAVADLLVGASEARAVVLVLEDCHWADASTLLLLRHLARAAGEARVLLLATFRDTGTDVSEPLAETLADLRRSEHVVRLHLYGLSNEEVAEFVRGTTGGSGAGVAELAQEITDLTGGNPFLLCEFWRELEETGMVEIAGDSVALGRAPGELGTPESVREVVSQRLARLAPPTTDLLELAATAGSEFDLATIRPAARVGDPELRTALDEAVRSGMIEELPERALVYRFTHELVRRALYDRLDSIRRAEFHLRVGEALEAAADDSARTLADLAHHFAAAAALGGAARAVEYNRRAAAAATSALAFDEAAERLRTALELGIADPAAEAEGLIELGFAYHRAGKALDALDAFRSAAEIARSIADAPLLARAAIGYEEACWRPGMHDQGAGALLEEAAAGLGAEDSTLRVGLLAGLARALDFQGDHARGAAVRTSAIAMARRLDDRAGLATVLMRAYWSRGASSLDEILAMLTEARDLGEQLGNTEIRAEAMAWTVPAYVALCDIDSARREVAAVYETAEQTAQPFLVHVAAHYASAIALCDGRLEQAEERAMRSQEWSRLLTGRDASGIHGIQMFSVRREQGRLGELAPVVRMLAGGGGEIGPWQPGLVSLLAELGMEAEARRELARVARAGLEPLRESLWLASLTYLTDAGAALGDRAIAALVYPELEPLSGTNVMIGHLVACYGACDRYLGMLAATLGDRKLAARHFEAALALNRRMGALTWLAHTAYEYGRLLRSEDGEEERAAALLDEAGELASAIGMATLLRRVNALRSDVAPALGLPDDLSAREAEILRLVARGLSNREIGETVFISEHTVASHVRSILRKTECANRTEAASYAHRRGLAEA